MIFLKHKYKTLNDTFKPILFYNLPVVGKAFLVSPAMVVLQGVYAKYFGLELTVIATIFFVARIFDAVTDPLIGIQSDRSRAKGNTRKPWVLVGGVAFVICAYFLFIPPPSVGAGYFLFWFLAFYLAWTLFEIPHYGWGTELTREPKLRTALFSIRGFMFYAGGMCFYALPFLPIFATHDITPDTLKLAVLIAGLYLVPTLFIAVRYAPDGKIIQPRRHETLLTIIKTTIYNKPFLFFLGTYFFTGLGGGMWLSLSFIVLDSYFGVGDRVAGMFFTAKLAALISLPLWFMMANRAGKRWTLALSQIFYVFIVLIPFFLSPGEQSYLPLLVVTVVFYIMNACYSAVAPALLADVVDYGILKFGADRAGTYFSAYAFLVKITAGVGGALGLAIAGLLGFDPTVSTENAVEAEFAIQVAFCLLPAVMFFIGFLFITLMPLTPHHSVIIRKRLEQRAVNS